jgi:hypothetical protein
LIGAAIVVVSVATVVRREPTEMPKLERESAVSHG